MQQPHKKYLRKPIKFYATVPVLHFSMPTARTLSGPKKYNHKACRGQGPGKAVVEGPTT